LQILGKTTRAIAFILTAQLDRHVMNIGMSPPFRRKKITNGQMRPRMQTPCGGSLDRIKSKRRLEAFAFQPAPKSSS
jgi:hypothetical protein